ncbi:MULTISPECIES: glutathione S-transferase family protein [Methylobacterium]|uniref:Glutathione S-transferase domain protein n=1 Tax=Methylobacterium radiotolerans (strain ATCC 27329 / DSM 1819 / JCM 2831 / NBRC 15690 / NCIMB 10815 / 0-1) TaxID=426355 RepID=B1M1H8_METRJ|nr:MULTISPECIES: glutathione S-transferase family protein [Methylobacterium]ACB26153.1 Glutathione S-transferase domain protein [Methylobacterium radiotolerans JCM 2831]KZB99558.1 Disulfide-bond oxidoreductase YfcG [Methylobacterium radiotolerans]MBN6822247.1 glutathione S-transferase family protein [Methylobacterium organophilum]MDE3749654.1 glutathione S-transferase family protein [Methylobacterium radiotolerans]OXE38069.1 glutathione S-transferase [Methylobacterium radiotolerans]
MITLYHAPQSRSSRIVWLLEELGVPYTIAPVSIFRPMTGEGVPDDANPHPDKRVPAVLHAGALIAESQAIVLYLAETFPEAGLAPAVGTPERGAYLTWLAWYVAEFEPALFAGLTGELAGSPQKRRTHEAVVRRLEAALARGPYVMGDRFSGADILIGSALGFGRTAFPASAAFDAYLERCRARPAARRGAAKDGASGPQSA